MRSFLIDTDTASDDAVAILMALRWPDVDVKAITIVTGNMPVTQGVKNALYTVELCGKNTPVYIGADKPLLRPNAFAEWFHGPDGMGNQNYPPARQQPEPDHAVDVIIETVKANPGIVLVTLGPLTNIALAVSRAPEIAPLVSRCVVMGGAACTEGNVTPAAEYNIWIDPEAAKIAFHAGLPIEMVGWEHCRFDKVLNMDDIAYIRSLNTPLGHFTVDCNETAIEAFYVQTGERGIALPDPVTMAIALDPSVATQTARHYVDVETISELTRGQTVVDRLNVAANERNRDTWAALVQRPPNASVVWEVDAARWKETLYQTLR
ncbi:MAG: nucleoside hydrolase [Anaerolineae bacterium]|nr:nucleoside hydrolase [Anaerolineae bacterium]